MFKISGVIKNFFIYSFGSVFQKGISIFIAPIVMRLLTPADYGLLSLATSFISILATVAGLGMRQLLSIEYFHCDVDGRQKIVNDIISVYSFLMIPFFILLFFCMPLINKYFFVGQAFNFLIFIVLLVSFLHFFIDLFYQILQYQGKSIRLTVIQTVSAILLFSLNLLFLYCFGWGVSGVFVSRFVSMWFVLLFGIYFYVSQLYHVNLKFTSSIQKGFWYVKKGLPFVPRVLFGWILAVGDRWILAKYSTMQNVGIYSVADLFGQVFHLVIIIPISYAYLPYLLEKFAANKKNLLSIEFWNQRNMICVMVFMFLFVTVGYIVCKPLAFWIIPSKYHSAIGYVWLLLIGYVFLLGSYFASAFLHFQKRVWFLLLSLFLSAMLNIVLNILLIGYLQILGCVVATLVSYLFYFGITVVYNVYRRKFV